MRGKILRCLRLPGVNFSASRVDFEFGARRLIRNIIIKSGKYIFIGFLNCDDIKARDGPRIQRLVSTAKIPSLASALSAFVCAKFPSYNGIHRACDTDFDHRITPANLSGRRNSDAPQRCVITISDKTKLKSRAGRLNYAIKRPPHGASKPEVGFMKARTYS